MLRKPVLSLQWLIMLGALMVAATLAITAQALDVSPQTEITFPTETLVIHSQRGEQTFDVEVASNDEQRARGLMFREKMGLNAGMLFVFDGTGERYFWMKNTPLSLDMIFIGEDGRIGRIEEGTTPFSEKIIGSRVPALYVLELNAGTSRRLGLAPGDQVVSPSIK